MKRIPLSGTKGSGLFVTIDDVDYPIVSQYRWSLKPCYGRRSNLRYAHARVNGKTTMLHRLLMGPIPTGMVGDHINGDGLDNRRANLRFVTRAINMVNHHKKSPNDSSQYPGVSWDEHNNKWHAQIKSGRVNKHLGFFVSERDAATAYKRAAKQLYGDDVICSTSSIV